MSYGCVSEPFEPDNLAGQIEYLIDNQDVYLVKKIRTLDPMTLEMELHSGERYMLTVAQLAPEDRAEAQR